MPSCQLQVGDDNHISMTHGHGGDLRVPGSSRWKRMRQVSSLRAWVPYPRKLTAAVLVSAHQAFLQAVAHPPTLQGFAQGISCSHRDPFPSPKGQPGPFSHLGSPPGIWRAPAPQDTGCRGEKATGSGWNLEVQNCRDSVVGRASRQSLAGGRAGSAVSPQHASPPYP